MRLSVMNVELAQEIIREELAEEVLADLSEVPNQSNCSIS